jgi:phage shock protein E
MFGNLVSHGNGSTVRDYDVAGVKRLIGQGALVIDVRMEAEAASGMVPQAKLIPLHDMPHRLGDVERLVGGDKSRPVIVYCRSGNRSGSAKTILQRAGFSNVVNAGGYDSLR